MYLKIMSFTCTYHGPKNKLHSLPSYVCYNIVISCMCEKNYKLLDSWAKFLYFDA